MIIELHDEKGAGANMQISRFVLGLRAVPVR